VVISLVVGVDRHAGPRSTRASRWERLWSRLLAALRGRDPEPTPGPGLPAVAAGADPAAFLNLFAHVQLPLLDYLYGMTRDRELAADLVQDTFLRAWAAAPALAGITQPRAWLYRIATHLALNAIRHRRHFEWLPLSHMGPVRPADHSDASQAWLALPPVELPADAGDLAASVAEREAIWTVLAQLPPPWRGVLLLQTTAGFEVSEIATLLQISEGNVRKRLFRAKERFRALYRQLDMEGDAR
jgi:RNA polymerase sigma-70 factor, ECF subfamily